MYFCPLENPGARIRTMNKERAIELNDTLSGGNAEDLLKYIIGEFRGRIVFASSMGAEDQVLFHMIHTIEPSVPVFTLDTGRIFPETYELIERTAEKYNKEIMIFFPDKEKVERMVSEKGINLFYHSVENRKQCCQVRKNDPLKRALKDYDVWICGLRKEQSSHRSSTELIEWDEQHEMIKVNPLLEWKNDQVWSYIKGNKIPYNFLHDKGFPSIGCQPCTRAILSGEDFRSGRWWWEESDHKECGIHRKTGDQ